MDRFKQIKIWLQGFRLRTLPLALSSTTLGSLLALSKKQFSLPVFIFASLTTLFLQILSNLANDYGDAKNGKDDHTRLGPTRITHTGMVSFKQIKTMIWVFIFLSLVSGSLLIYFGTRHAETWAIIAFFIVGISAIYAAIKYTIGKNPYGYLGFGDIFVFIYFGIVGVAGTYYMHTQEFMPSILLPASAIGLLSAGVLNLNNLRDIVSDANTGKKTLAVRLGIRRAKIYHGTLLVFSVLASIAYTVINYTSYYQLVYLVTLPLFYINIRTVVENTVPVELNTELKKLAMSTFLFALTFGISQLI